MVRNIPEYLMIEDNVYDLELALFDLEEHGIENKFHVLRDGAEALDYFFTKDGVLKAELPKVIFLDLHMPRISGLDFLRRLKSHEQTKRIPIVVLKSSISPVEMDECQRLGVNHFTEKPLEYKNFINVIKNVNTDHVSEW